VSGGRWWLRLVVLVAAAAAVLLIGGRLEMDPDPVRVVLTTAAVVVLVGLLLDAAPPPAPGWRLEEAHVADFHRRDPRTAANLRILEHHLAMNRADSALRDRLAELVEQVLLVRHGEHPETAGAYELMGPELTAVVNDPPRKLRREEIERCVLRIEEL
jgi:hypothetical protein